MTQPITHNLVQTLRDISDLSSLDDQALLELVGASANLLWKADEQIFAAGDPADALFIVLSGSVRIIDDNGQKIADIGPGDYFGEHAALLHTPRSKGAVAVEDCELMVIPASAMQPLLSHNRELGERFRQKLEARIIETSARAT